MVVIVVINVITRPPKRGLVVAELLERGRRFQNKLLKYVRAAHQIFMGTLVPALKIDDDKLVR